MESTQEGGLSCSPGMGHPKAWTVYNICLASPASTGYLPLRYVLCVSLVACY